MSIFNKTVHPEKLAADYLEQDNQHEPQLDKNLWADRTKRDKEAASIPEWEEFRELTSEIKKHTLTHLDGYLLQFEENATKRGAIVHWARDAREHNEILLEILQSHKVKEVIKS
jgi:L-lactate dehydrogenase complex protein LldF